MIARRRTARIAFRATGRWVRVDGAVHIEVADISAHGLFVAERLDMPIGQLQQIEVELPTGAVRLLVVPRHAAVSEWTKGLGVEIFAASPIDHNLWLSNFRDAHNAVRAPLARTRTVAADRNR